MAAKFTKHFSRLLFHSNIVNSVPLSSQAVTLLWSRHIEPEWPKQCSKAGLTRVKLRCNFCFLHANSYE